ncbi:MAG: N-acetylneuraminate synthase [Clostridiales bacterium]|nr:N-acetylneuraminate synthase [Clostridiales bacterium]
MNKTYIIAEAGVNHNGDMNRAKEMICEAKKAGADAVKFQTYVTENLVSKQASKAEYQIKNTSNEETQFNMLKKLELSFEEFQKLSIYAKEIGIDFLSTPFDEDSIDFLSQLSMRFWKIPSGEITNKPYLIKLAKTKKPIILSTGMSTIEEISDALEVFDDYNRDNITLLHCNTEYPTPYGDVNLAAMKTMKEEFNLQVGYSDHTEGIEVPVAAVALGASVIEKHFTLNKALPGPDHKASLEPNELTKMIKSIRNIEKAMGDGVKMPSESEMKNITVARKSIVAKCPINKGEEFTEKNLAVKRPGEGISPMKWFDILGRKAKKDFEEDELIEI